MGLTPGPWMGLFFSRNSVTRGISTVDHKIITGDLHDTEPR